MRFSCEFAEPADTAVCAVVFARASVGSFLAARIGKILHKKLGIAPAAPLAAPSAPAAPVPGAASKPRKRKKTAEAEDVDMTAASAAFVAASASSAVAAAAAAPSAASRTPIPLLPPMPTVFSPRTLEAAAFASAAPTAAAFEPPACPFGGLCYRTNPAHFIEQSHPADHPMAVHALTAPRRAHPQRSQSEVVVLSDSSPSPQPPVARSAHRAPVRPIPVDDADDFMSGNDSDVVDLTSPPVPAPAMSRTLSTPAFSSAAAASSKPAPLPPLHPQSVSIAPPPPPAAIFASNGHGSAPAAPAAKKAKADKMYKPKVNSSAYALLMALFDASPNSGSGSLNKSQLLAAALAHFRADKQAGAQADVHTSLWTGMSTLLARDLVDKSLTPILYSLTALGRTTAQLFAPASMRANDPQPESSPDDFLASPSPAPASADASSARRSPIPSAAAAASSNGGPVRAPSASPSPSPPPAVSLRRGSCHGADFDVLLVIDVRERSGRKDAAYMIERLGREGIGCEARALSVGDFMFVARLRRSPSCEVVLDCLVERKRVGDLVSSIRDGRYHEQRARLKKTRLQRVMYIIEGPVTRDTVHGLPLTTVESVLTSMNVRRHISGLGRTIRPQI